MWWKRCWAAWLEVYPRGSLSPCISGEVCWDTVLVSPHRECSLFWQSRAFPSTWCLYFRKDRSTVGLFFWKSLFASICGKLDPIRSHFEPSSVMQSWGFCLSPRGPFASHPWSSARASQWLAQLPWKLEGCVSVAQKVWNLQAGSSLLWDVLLWQPSSSSSVNTRPRAWLVTEPGTAVQECAAGSSGGSWVRGKYQSHTPWHSWGWGNPGFHCVLVLRGCCTCRGMELGWLGHCARDLGGSSSLPGWWGGKENQPCPSCLLFCAAIALQRAEAPYPACLLWLTIQPALIIKK